MVFHYTEPFRMMEEPTAAVAIGISAATVS